MNECGVERAERYRMVRRRIAGEQWRRTSRERLAAARIRAMVMAGLGGAQAWAVVALNQRQCNNRTNGVAGVREHETPHRAATREMPHGSSAAKNRQRVHMPQISTPNGQLFRWQGDTE